MTQHTLYSMEISPSWVPGLYVWDVYVSWFPRYRREPVAMGLAWGVRRAERAADRAMARAMAPGGGA